MCTGDDTIMLLLTLKQERGGKKVGMSQHTILPSVMHLLPQGAATCCRLSWTGPGQTGPSWPKLGLFTQHRIWTIFFHYRFLAHPEPSSHIFSVPCLFPFHVQLFAKNSKTKKIFLLISCSLQRFYFVLKKEKRNKNKSSLEESHNCAAID